MTIHWREWIDVLELCYGWGGMNTGEIQSLPSVNKLFKKNIKIAILHYVSIIRGHYTISCIGIFGGLEYKNITFDCIDIWSPKMLQVAKKVLKTRKTWNIINLRLTCKCDGLQQKSEHVEYLCCYHVTTWPISIRSLKVCSLFFSKFHNLSSVHVMPHTFCAECLYL